MSKYDEAIFFWIYERNVHGILAAHVNDFIHRGSELSEENVTSVIREKFKTSKQASESFHYLALEIEQNLDGIIVHQ